MAIMTKYRKIMAELAEEAGGEVSEERFLVQPGVLVLHDGNNRTDAADKLFERFKIYRGELKIEDVASADEISKMELEAKDIDLQLAEFAARITYLSFRDEEPTEETTLAFHRQLIERKHTSPYSMGREPTLLMIMDLASALEIICHKKRFARTSSSRTLAMLDPLFRSGVGKIAEMKREIVNKSLDARRDLICKLALEHGINLDPDPLASQSKVFQAAFPNREERYDAVEDINDTWPSNRVIAGMQSSSREEWDKIIRKRMAEKGTVENNLLEVLQLVKEKLNGI